MKIMPRRTFLGWLSLALTGCVKAISELGAVASGGSAASPSPSTSATGMPTSAPSPSASASPTAMPTPTPTPRIPAVLDASHANSAALSAMRVELPTMLQDSVSFSVQKIGNADIPNALTVHVYASSKDVSVFRSQDAVWEPVKAAAVEYNETTSSAAVTITEAKEGERYLVTGKEITNLSTSLSDISQGAPVDAQLTESPLFKEPVPATVQIVSGPSQRFTEKKTLLVFVHGAGSERYESEQYLWKPLLTWIANSSFAAEFRKRFRVALYRYNSTIPFSGNAQRLADMINTTYGYYAHNIIAVGYSMGGVLCREAYLLNGEGTFRSMITLGAPHRGSPLACPKLMRYAISSLPYPTFFLVFYELIMSRLFAALQSGVKSVTDLVKSIETPANEGFRSLCTYEEEFGVPSAEFDTKISFGPAAGIKVHESLSSKDRLLTSWYALSERLGKKFIGFLYQSTCWGDDTREENTVKYVNAIGVQCAYQASQTPSVIAYGGYCIRERIDEMYALFEKAKTADGLSSIMKDTSIAMQQNLLRLLAFVVAPLIPTKTGRKRLFWDGLVPLEDALGLANGITIEEISLDGSPQHSDVAIASRKAPWVKRMRVWRGYSHLDLVMGKGPNDDTYFSSIVSDLFALEDDIQKSKTTSISDAEKWGISSVVERAYVGNVSLSRSNVWNTTVDNYLDSLTAEATGPNRAKATFTIKTVTELFRFDAYGGRQSGGSTYTMKTYEDSFLKIGGMWHFAA